MASCLMMACAGPTPPPSPSAVPAVADSPFLGCWSLAAAGIPSDALASPGGVQFVDSTVAGDASNAWLKLRPGHGIQCVRIAYWRLIARDSVQLGWGWGLSGVMALAKVRGDSLLGYASYVTDGGSHASGPLIGVRANCGSLGL
jgi:hypothetical protein